MAKAKFKKDDVVVFAGYTDDSVEKILQVGQRLRIHEVDKDGTMSAVPVEGGDGDTVFSDEVMSVEEWEAKINAEKGITDGEAEALPEEVAEDLEAAAAPDKAKGKSKKKAVIEKATKTKGASKKVATKKAVEEDKEVAKAPAEQGVLPEVIHPETETVGEDRDVLEVEHTSSVAALLAEKDALEAAQELVNRAEETDFTLGGVLSHIQREGIYQRLGYDGKRGFEDYIEKHLGVKYRKARYLIRTYEYFSTLGIDEKRLAAIGWSKAKELVGVATKENFDELMTFAEDKSHTRDDLIEHIRTTYKSAEAGEGQRQEKAKQTVLTFRLFNDQSETVNRALTAAKAQAGTDDPNAALEFICGEWSMMSENNEMTLEEAVRMVEARYKVTLSVGAASDPAQADIEGALAHQDPGFHEGTDEEVAA